MKAAITEYSAATIILEYKRAVDRLKKNGPQQTEKIAYSLKNVCLVNLELVKMREVTAQVFFLAKAWVVMHFQIGARVDFQKNTVLLVIWGINTLRHNDINTQNIGIEHGQYIGE